MKISRLLSVFVVSVALVACEEAAAPEGQPGDLTVAAYIDNDASGSLSTGDTPLANFEVALLRGSQQITTARTAADGRVTFSDLEPGSYRVEAVSDAPAGATLASNPSPAAVIDFRGRAVSVDFRYVFFPGVIAGRVFRDENSNQTFEQGTDVPGPGLWVFLRADDAGVPGAKLDSVRTDSLGAYRFGLVAPGSYFLEFENPATIDYGASGATRRITVVGNQSVVVNALYTGSLVISIAEARARPNGSVVTVVGNLTAPPGAFRQGANSEIWVQDATGGIAGFSVPTTDSTRLRLGDRVEVTGTRSAFSGQVQITTNAAQVKTLGGNTIVAPKAITGTELNSRTDEGRLVVLTGLLVDSIGQGTGQDTVFTTAPDAQIVRIQLTAGSNANFTDTIFHVGTRYTVTGLLTQRNGVARLKPRFPSDIVPETVAPPPVARVVINELMPDPALVGDGFGEWIELHNWGTASVDIQGWKLFGNTVGDTARITASVVINPGDYVVLGINGDPAANGGVQVDFVYRSGYSLNNSMTTGDVVILRDAAGATVDSVVYVSPPIGASMALRDPSADNTDAKGPNWQTSTTPYNASDEGTPGSQNDGYIPPVQPTAVIRGGIGQRNSRQP
jgi:DNA/RNA endonuclease YhcR with UshA esterase domain